MTSITTPRAPRKLAALPSSRKQPPCVSSISLDLKRAEEKDEEVLACAARIMKRRMLRMGKITDASSVVDYLKARLGPLQREVFLVILLDTRHRILTADMVFYGTIDSAEIHPREVVKLALRHNAAAVICAHNHPSGDPQPSAADRVVTAQLKCALALVDIRLLDHVVICPFEHVSLAQRGWL